MNILQLSFSYNLSSVWLSLFCSFLCRDLAFCFIYFMFTGATVNGIFLKIIIFYDDCCFYVEIEVIDFLHVLPMYLATLMNSLLSSNSLCVDSCGHSSYTITLSVNKDIIFPFQSSYNLFPFFALVHCLVSPIWYCIKTVMKVSLPHSWSQIRCFQFLTKLWHFL